MTSVSQPVRVLVTVVVVAAGLFALSDLLGGPTLGRWQSAVLGLGMVAWFIGLNGGMRSGDRGERRLFWIGTGASSLLLVAGVIEAL